MSNDTAKKNLSKEDWEFVKKQLDSGYFGRVELLADGFEVSFMRGLVGKNRIGIATYVNGHWKGEWILNKTEEARKFFCEHKRKVYDRKYLRALKGIYSRKELEKKAAETVSSFSPIWPSFRALRSALLKRDLSMELVKPSGLLTSITPAETGSES